MQRFAVAFAAAALAAMPAGAAWAEPPVTLDPATKIVDPSGVLGSKKGEVQDAIKKLGADHGVAGC